MQSGEGEEQSRDPEDVQARLDEQRGFASYFRDAAWQDEVVSQYVESLEAMIAACRRAESAAAEAHACGERTAAPCAAPACTAPCC